MNCQQITEHWDEALDGELPADEDRAFHAHLAACRACGRRWEEEESAWLVGMVPAERHDLAIPAKPEDSHGRAWGGSAELNESGQAFAQRVLSAWDRQDQDQARPAVLAHLGEWRAAAAAMALAATVVLAVFMGVRSGTAPPEAPRWPPRLDPLAALADDLNYTTQQPMQLIDGIRQTAALLNWQNALAQLIPSDSGLSGVPGIPGVPGVPDPADILEPGDAPESPMPEHGDML
ncbi:MAG: zf-HC2 domain-containing protein [Phycisphaeraceae bacterium]